MKKKTLSPAEESAEQAAKNKTDSDENSLCEKFTLINPFENSATYKKNESTGEWEIINPSGSIAYNYLYRDDTEKD